MGKIENRNTLKHIVIHYFKKEKHMKPEPPDLALNVAPVEDDNTKTFFDNFIKIINSKTKNFTYNTFLSKDKNRRHVFDIIENYKSEVYTDNDFLNISHEIANLFEQCLNESSAATGGQMIIFDYITDDGTLKLAITLMNTEATSSTENHSFISAVALNMNHMALAAIINISRWTNPVEFKRNPNIVQFIAGERDISKYYREGFIGCEFTSNSKIHTQTIMSAIEDYMVNFKKKKQQEWYSIRTKACEYMDENKNETVLKNLLNHIMENEEEQDEFIEFCNDKYELSSSFKPHMLILKSWKKLVYNKKGIKVEIEPERLRDGTAEYIPSTGGHIGYLKIADSDGDIARGISLFAE